MSKHNTLKKTDRPEPVPPPAPSETVPNRVESNPFELDRLIHERMRLGILSALAGGQSRTFNELKKLLNTTDGNLSVHARKLEEAGYVSCSKFFDGRLPKTEYRISDAGKEALERYLNHLEAIIQTARPR
jgi:DNA-binding transcriptional ArsR family regulator